MRLALCVFGSSLLFGCGTNGPDWVQGFDPGSTPDGYTRYVSPTVKAIEPGADVEWCQWVSNPSDKALDVIDLKGVQSATGHHAVLYATTETKFKMGESHECTNDDMISISFVGAIGGEGTAGNSADFLPAGLNFRLPAGQSLMINTHWVNATDETVDGQSVIDVKFAPASDTRVIADLFANNADTFEIPANSAYSHDVNCVLPHDMNFAMVTNHMHTFGSSAYTELIHQDGSKERLIEDAVWHSEEQFKPNYMKYSADAPKVGKKGDTFHTHCEWKNTTDRLQLFPEEMCDGVAFYFPSEGQLICENGAFGNR